MSVAETYIADVLSGKQITGQWIRKACQRHEADRRTRTDIWFDPDAGQRVIDFIQTFCIPSAQSTVMELMPWEQAFIYILYGWKRLDGFRRFRRAYLEIAKKNGKTGLAAALALYHLVADGELSARVFIAATALKQARECFTEAVSMRNREPELKALIHQSGNQPVLALYEPETGSRLSPMARGSDSQDGAVVSAAILDELHRWKTGDNLWSILRYGGDNRKQPMLICITTAGASAGKSSLCWAEHEYGMKILDGEQKDDEVCPFIFALDPKDDWKDERNWIKPNPSLGAILPLEALRTQFKETVGKPTSLGEYKRYRLNIWTDEVSDPAVEIEKWDDCCRVPLSKYPDPKRLRRESLEELAGRTCFAGADCAPKNDTSSLVLLFPPLVKGEKWRIIPFFWIPNANIESRCKRDRVPYDRWRDDGFLKATEGNITDFRSMAQDILALSQKFNLKEIWYDDAYSHELIRDLAEAGFPMGKMSQFPQNHVKMNPPCLEFGNKIARGDFSHDNDPVLHWQMQNLRWNTQKSTGFIKADKDRKREKNDGCVALIMALACASDPENIVKPKQKMFYVSSR